MNNMLKKEEKIQPGGRNMQIEVIKVSVSYIKGPTAQHKEKKKKTVEARPMKTFIQQCRNCAEGGRPSHAGIEGLVTLPYLR